MGRNELTGFPVKFYAKFTSMKELEFNYVVAEKFLKPEL